MADESTQSLVIDAPATRIMGVIADFAAYPEWAGNLKSTEVLAENADGQAEQVRFALDAGVLKDKYTLAYEWAADGLSVSWTLVEGQMQKSQRGSYRLEPEGTDGPTTVTYTLSVDLTIPMIGLFKRKAEKVVMDTALKELKRRVEESTSSARPE
ncbi:SRPBCC family protein [Actinoalloteichus hymeniacidonis]|uniref:Polyketide cyclase / dehydrase and lipid transport n=1 Tax=Actinoalloteichus hymeniacidonis TaxID=340345 RepID=A0AAC9HU23_9PSEU|nr:SRPBCC family protein [Actinoalloteichus hymeniacidonis]AOS65126.1 Polyketide cyclase / dehydrase and lipid transport [Actinoalloteichus hymeniacidonis]MBB5906795.1 putative membrane protein [Actinoalloteichus hymeniacidonis]